MKSYCLRLTSHLATLLSLLALIEGQFLFAKPLFMNLLVFLLTGSSLSFLLSSAVKLNTNLLNSFCLLFIPYLFGKSGCSCLFRFLAGTLTATFDKIELDS